MIPEAAITHWRRIVPWSQDSQIEQDLILSRALIELYQDPLVGGRLRLRGGPDSITLKYRVQSEIPPVAPLRLKLEINTREHVCLLGAAQHDFQVKSPWYAGSSVIETFRLEELLATKLRALYQRRKGRDLFDLFLGLQAPGIDAALVADTFLQYMRFSGSPVSQRLFEDNLAEKFKHPGFHGDLAPLLAAGEVYDPENARKLVVDQLISRL
jgi:hypothetical protein